MGSMLLRRGIHRRYAAQFQEVFNCLDVKQAQAQLFYLGRRSTRQPLLHRTRLAPGLPESIYFIKPSWRMNWAAGVSTP